MKVGVVFILISCSYSYNLISGEIVAIVLGTLGLVTFAILVIVLFLYFSVGYLKSKLIVEVTSSNNVP